MDALVLQRKSTGASGDVVWWYDGARCIRRIPATEPGGKARYTAEWHPTRGIYLTRIQPALSLADARAWLRHTYLPGREAVTATGRRFIVA